MPAYPGHQVIEDDSVQHSNIAEEEMGQLHSIHHALNAIAAIQRSIPTGASREFCVDCSESIPLARRSAMQGCLRCIHCQTLRE